AARVHAIERGKTLGDRTLIAFGGAAPLHAARLAEKLGMDRIVIPTSAGVGSAVGFLRAPVAYEVVRSRFFRLSAFDAGVVNAMLHEMAAEARQIVATGAPAAAIEEHRHVEMRYIGQGHEIAVDLPLRDLSDGNAALLRELFEARYAEIFGRAVPGVERIASDFGPKPPVVRRPAGRIQGRTGALARRPRARQPDRGTGDHRRGADGDRRVGRVRRRDRSLRSYRVGAQMTRNDPTAAIHM